MFMDTKKINGNLSENYLAASQLVELLEDVELCATRLVEATKKAKINSESFKNKCREIID